MSSYFWLFKYVVFLILLYFYLSKNLNAWLLLATFTPVQVLFLSPLLPVPSAPNYRHYTTYSADAGWL